MRKTTCALLSLLILSISQSASALDQPVNKGDGHHHVKDRIIVKYKKSTSHNLINTYHTLYGTSVHKTFKHLEGIQSVQLPPNLTVEAAIKLYENNPDVEYVEPDYILKPALVPNDTSFTSLWGLDNTGQTGGTADADINAPEAWDITTGSSTVIVAVIDTGIDYTHPDLAANMWTNPGEIPGNGVDDDGNGIIDDVYGLNAITNNGDPFDDVGHGTHVAGTIAGVGNNATGVSGVSWNTKIISCKFLGPGGGAASFAVDCINYLIDLKTRSNNPVNIVLSNNSWGGPGYSQSIFDAIQASENAGMLFVVAAGNSNSNNDTVADYPANYNLPSILTVAATDHNDQIATFSNYGVTTVDIGAPGVNILSTVPTGSCSLCTTNGYRTLNGTSMAAPHASGLGALIKAQNPGYGWPEIKNLLMTSGTPISALSTNTVTGKRIRAADLNGIGALTCSNQVLQQRFSPAGSSTNFILGQTVVLSMRNVNCASPNGNVTVTNSAGGTSITLLDNGIGADKYTGDGIYTASLLPASDTTLTFPGNDVVTVNLIRNYSAPTQPAYNYRSILSGTALNIGDDAVVTINSPFPIQYSGLLPGYSSINISDNGALRFTSSTIDYLNKSLPYSLYDSIVAPLWDDLDPSAAGDDVFWEIQGTAPNRELIIEWRNVKHYTTAATPNTLGVTFQVVFFENSADVLFNYQDVDFSNTNFNNGASATVGVQVASTLARQFSFDTASLSNNTSLLFKLAPILPLANAGADQTISINSNVTLNGSASANAFSYSWTQTSGTTVTLTGANTATPSFTAPATAGTLAFDLTIQDGSGNSDTDSVTITVNDPPPSPVSSGDEGGGCTINPNAGFDPFMPFMLLLGMIYILRRKFTFKPKS